MFNHPTKTTQVRIFRFNVLTRIFLDFTKSPADVVIAQTRYSHDLPRHFSRNLTLHLQRLPANVLVWLVGQLTQNSVAMRGPKEFPRLLCLNVKNSIPLSYSSLSGKTTVWPLHTNWQISIFQNSTSNNATLLGITISKELIKVIPLKMMYYSDFLCPHPIPWTPPFQDFHNSGLKGKKWWQPPWLS